MFGATIFLREKPQYPMNRRLGRPEIQLGGWQNTILVL
jgi:hypothetical protein